MIRCVVFDFDGTLVLSNEIKREGFFQVARRFSDGVPLMEDVLREVDGDRVAVMARFASEVNAGNSEPLVVEYTRWCEERIIVCPERAGASRALRGLRAAGCQIHISSATPADSLRAIVDRRYPPHMFEGVHGGYARKTAILRHLVDAAGIPSTDVLCVGDGCDDLAAAESAGCHFAGVAGGSLERRRPTASLIADLTDVVPLVARLGSTRAAFA